MLVCKVCYMMNTHRTSIRFARVPLKGISNITANIKSSNACIILLHIRQQAKQFQGKEKDGEYISPPCLPKDKKCRRTKLLGSKIQETTCIGNSYGSPKH